MLPVAGCRNMLCPGALHQIDPNQTVGRRRLGNELSGMIDISTDQNNAVSAYFDDISDDYRDRYEPRNPFHSYFFGERLRVATEGLDFENRSVLDIGAGTGPLYDYLIKYPGVDYYACDISSKMLARSAIPADRAFPGKATDIHFPKDTFDYIFLLGVTTYQTPEELKASLRFIRERLASGGAAILSFTNRSSLDYVSRRVLRVARPLVWKGVLAQSFVTYAYRLSDVEEMIAGYDLRLNRMVYLNLTVSPFNTLLPRLSVSLARWLSQNCSASLLPFLSADFLLFLEKGA